MKKPFRETRVGEFLQSKGFNTVLSAVGAVFPVASVLGNVKDLVLGDPKWKELSPVDQAQFLELHALAVKELDLVLQDTANARAREVDLVRSGKSNLTQNVLAFVGVFAFFTAAGYMLVRGLGQMTSEQSFIIGNVTGILAAIAKDIYQYYFGSSKGSKDKTDLLKERP